MKPIQNSKDLQARLNRLAQEISWNIEYPNWGGCGVIAGKVGTALKKLGIDCEVVTPIYDDMPPPAVIRKNVKDKSNCADWDHNGLRRSHLAVRLKYKRLYRCWDSDGFTSASEFGTSKYPAPKNFGDGLTVAECVKLASKPYGWNSDFNRKQIPAISRMVKKYLLEGKVE